MKYLPLIKISIFLKVYWCFSRFHDNKYVYFELWIPEKKSIAHLISNFPFQSIFDFSIGFKLPRSYTLMYIYTYPTNASMCLFKVKSLRKIKKQKLHFFLEIFFFWALGWILKNKTTYTILHKYRCLSKYYASISWLQASSSSIRLIAMAKLYKVKSWSLLGIALN